MNRSVRSEEGMTLIELIVSVLILVLVVTPLVLVLEFAFSATRATSQTTTESAGAQLMSSYFESDVQGADFVWTSTKQTSFSQAIPQDDPSKPLLATTQCGSFAGSGNSGNSGATLLELQWRDGSTSPSPVLVATYDVSPASAYDTSSGTLTGPASLVRHTWRIASGSTTCTALDSTTVVYALNETPTSGDLPVKVTCDPVSCSKPDSVEINVNALSQDVHNSGLYNTPYKFDLTASRRLG